MTKINKQIESSLAGKAYGTTCIEGLINRERTRPVGWTALKNEYINILIDQFKIGM